MTKITTSIQPWLSVHNSCKASRFYMEAFGAMETHRMETPDGGLVVRLSIDGAEFWVSGQSSDNGEVINENLGGESVRFVLTVDNPDIVFEHALKMGAKEVFPVGEEYGWRLGRLTDPFGLHWEIGKEL